MASPAQQLVHPGLPCVRRLSVGAAALGGRRADLGHQVFVLALVTQ